MLGDQRYALQDGTLILVDTVPELRIRQVQVPESVAKLLSQKDLPSDEIRSALRAMARDHKEIREFFEDPNSSESDGSVPDESVAP